MTAVDDAQPAGPIPIEPLPTRLTLLDAEHWLAYDEDENLIAIAAEDMTDHHRRSVLAWLRRHAALMARHQAHADHRLYLDGLIDAHEYSARQRERQTVPPEVWIEDTRLVRRLVQLSPPAPRPPRLRRLLPSRLRGLR